MKEYICKYCKKELTYKYMDNYPIFLFGFFIKLCYACDNHNHLVLFLFNDFNKIAYIRFLVENSMYIDIDYISNLMSINTHYNNGFDDEICCKLSIDNSLTPENIENKIKTYLTFQ
jgi:hypothetical protein